MAEDGLRIGGAEGLSVNTTLTYTYTVCILPIILAYIVPRPVPAAKDLSWIASVSLERKIGAFLQPTGALLDEDGAEPVPDHQGALD